VLIRRGGEGLQALQHLVATAFRRQLGDDTRIVVDCNGYRRDKDAELKQMAGVRRREGAHDRARRRSSGRSIPTSRRIVHMVIAEDPTVTSESIGDAFMKTVIIARVVTQGSLEVTCSLRTTPSSPWRRRRAAAPSASFA
jgi:spoIIIJ-associated protein